MAVPRRLLAVSNGKLGEWIVHFDVPPVLTCPGRTPICEQSCYALRSRFTFSSVRERLRWCYEQSLRSDFVKKMRAELRVRAFPVVRLHVAGDFYSVEYIEKWHQVMRAFPRTRFYFYSRSFNVPELFPGLVCLASLDNVRAWWSVDVDSVIPDVVPPRVRLAYMQTDATVPDGVDLIFRTRAVLNAPRVSLPMLCPSDTPAGRRSGMNCGQCGHCFAD